MAKIVGLIPCLMLDNNRDANKEAIEHNYKHLNLDAIAIYDQSFQESDYDSRFTYVGYQPDRVGFTNARNGLLRWFYDSDYDYAFWLDANEKVSTPTINDTVTVIEALKADKLNDIDVIFATLGLWVSQDRIVAKQRDDYMTHVQLIPALNNKSYNWMHGLIMKNFKKYYDQPVFIDSRCDVKLGTPEDVYFSRLIRRYYNAYVAPTVVITKPSSNTSTHAGDGNGRYVYPPVKFDEVDQYILENVEKDNIKMCNVHWYQDSVSIPRQEYMKDKVAPYKSRKKESPSAVSKVGLF